MNDFPDKERRAILVATVSSIALSGWPGSAVTSDEKTFIELVAAKTPYNLLGSEYPASNLWLYNGMTPGPEIRVTAGDTVRVRFINKLDEPSSIHWHGIRIVNAMDGVSGLTQQPVQPGDHFDYVFEVPDAGSFWYHAHNKSWQQVAYGLYGPLIVDEAEPLVSRSHDLTLVVDDWRVDDQGSFHSDSLGSLRDWSHGGRLGNWLTVNGRSQPEYTLKHGETYRLRLINTCNARILQISLAEIDAQIIAYDGILFDKPRRGQDQIIELMPAQRVDLLITPSEKTIGQLSNTDLFALSEVSGREALDMVRFKIVEGSQETGPGNVQLTPNQITPPDVTDAREIKLRMGGGAMGSLNGMMYQGKPLSRDDIRTTGQLWAFNGVANLDEQPLFRARRGETIILNAVNDTRWPHGIHLHGHHFQVLERNGNKPSFIDWRDTFSVGLNETVKVAFVAENPGKWLLHCHMLEHAAAGMNTWFEVT